MDFLISLYTQSCFLKPVLPLPLQVTVAVSAIPHSVFTGIRRHSCPLSCCSWQSKGTCPGAIPEYPSPSL